MSTATARHPHLESTRVRARSQILARADREMKANLVRVRRDAGLTQKDIADILGVTQQAIQKLERYDSDPKLSTLSRYANAVGAIVDHSVSKDVGQSIWKAAGPRNRGSANLPSGVLTATAKGGHPAQSRGWAVAGRGTFGLAA